jgi:hypothetical protein
MAVQIQLRNDTTAAWAANNPILALGEIGIDTDLNQLRIGDGDSTWDELPYFVNASAIGGQLEGFLLEEEKGQAEGLATLDETGNIPESQLGAAQTIAAAAAATAEANAISAAETIAASAASSAVAGIVDSAPEILNTLNELSAALGNDADFATTITTAISDKAPLDSPTFVGTVDFTEATVLGVATEAPQIIHPFALGA